MKSKYQIAKMGCGIRHFDVAKWKTVPTHF